MLCSEVKATQRNKTVYHCQVLGGQGCGKTALVQGLVGKELVGAPSDMESVAVKALTVPNSVEPIYLVVSCKIFSCDKCAAFIII